MGCSLFLKNLVVLVEAAVVLCGLETEARSPYDFQGLSPECPDATTGKCPERSLSAVLPLALSSIADLMRLLQSHEWLESLLDSPAAPTDARGATGAERRDAAKSSSAEQTSLFDIELCFSPLFLHHRDFIEMTAVPVSLLASLTLFQKASWASFAGLLVVPY